MSRHPNPPRRSLRTRAAKWRLPEGMRAMARWLMVVLLGVAMGGHLMLLQTFAWGAMLAVNSGRAPMAEAVSRTFDGRHPCRLCRVVSESGKEDEKKPLHKAEVKCEIALPAAMRVPVPRSGSWLALGLEPRGWCLPAHRAKPWRPPRSA